MKEFTIVVTKMPTQVLFVTKSAMTFAALEWPIFVMNHFNMPFQIAASSKTGIAQIASMRPFVGMGF